MARRSFSLRGLGGGGFLGLGALLFRQTTNFLHCAEKGPWRALSLLAHRMAGLAPNAEGCRVDAGIGLQRFADTRCGARAHSAVFGPMVLNERGTAQFSGKAFGRDVDQTEPVVFVVFPRSWCFSREDAGILTTWAWMANACFHCAA